MGRCGELELVGFPLEHPSQLVVWLFPFRLHRPRTTDGASALPRRCRRWRAPPRLCLSYPCRRFRRRGAWGAHDVGRTQGRMRARRRSTGWGGSSRSRRGRRHRRGDGGAFPLGHGGARLLRLCPGKSHSAPVTFERVWTGARTTRTRSHDGARPHSRDPRGRARRRVDGRPPRAPSRAPLAHDRRRVRHREGRRGARVEGPRAPSRVDEESIRRRRIHGRAALPARRPAPPPGILRVDGHAGPSCSLGSTPRPHRADEAAVGPSTPPPT